MSAPRPRTYVFVTCPVLNHVSLPHCVQVTICGSGCDKRQLYSIRPVFYFAPPRRIELARPPPFADSVITLTVVLRTGYGGPVVTKTWCVSRVGQHVVARLFCPRRGPRPGWRRLPFASPRPRRTPSNSAAGSRRRKQRTLRRPWRGSGQPNWGGHVWSPGSGSPSSGIGVVFVDFFCYDQRGRLDRNRRPNRRRHPCEHPARQCHRVGPSCPRRALHQPLARNG